MTLIHRPTLRHHAKAAPLVASLVGSALLVTCCDAPSNDRATPRLETPQRILGNIERLTGRVEFFVGKRFLRSDLVRDLVTRLPQRRIDTFDRYYERKKQFFGVSAASLLEDVFDLPPEGTRNSRFVLEARDGYQVEVAGRLLVEEQGHFAYQDAEGPWQPIGAKKADPGPLYLVWPGADARHDERPRPWGIVRVKKLDSERRFEHLRPPGGFEDQSSAARGYELFSARCLPCHSINQEGGSVGPELNVPRNVLEYRDREKLGAFIRDPGSFRYSAMPSHSDLSEDDLESLLDYLQVMGRHKYDPHTEKLKKGEDR